MGLFGIEFIDIANQVDVGSLRAEIAVAVATVPTTVGSLTVEHQLATTVVNVHLLFDGAFAHRTEDVVALRVVGHKGVGNPYVLLVHRYDDVGCVVAAVLAVGNQSYVGRVEFGRHGPECLRSGLVGT